MKRYISIIAFISCIICNICNAGLLITNHTTKPAYVYVLGLQLRPHRMQSLLPGASEELGSPQDVYDIQYFIPRSQEHIRTFDVSHLPHTNKQHIAESTIYMGSIQEDEYNTLLQSSDARIMLHEKWENPHKARYYHTIDAKDKNVIRERDRNGNLTHRH